MTVIPADHLRILARLGDRKYDLARRAADLAGTLDSDDDDTADTIRQLEDTLSDLLDVIVADLDPAAADRATRRRGARGTGRGRGGDVTPTGPGGDAA